MLVLGRKKGESVVIGDDITVTVLEVRGGKIRLGFDAPQSVTINRSEILPYKTSREMPTAELPKADVPVAG